MIFVTFIKEKLSTLLVFFLFLLQPIDTCADIEEFVQKYKNIEMSPLYVERIRPYNHFIKYFSGFYYFKAHHVVSTDFLKALIIAESSGDSNAKSPKNALGLGQITYPTGRQAAKELSNTGFNFKYVNESMLRNLQPDDLFDPAVNILLTCYLISKYNVMFNGRLDLVLTAWNVGENHSPLKNGRPSHYKETEIFIGKVNGYYLHFLKNKTKDH